jgi:transposase-like protein
MAERGMSVDHSTIARWVFRLRADSESPHSNRDAPSQSVMAGRRNLRARGWQVDLIYIGPSIRPETRIDFLLSPT